jgi:hypothetical protein
MLTLITNRAVEDADLAVVATTRPGIDHAVNGKV